MSQLTCLHTDAKVRHLFTVPYLGKVLVCQPCRKALALRTVEMPLGLVPIDCGRAGYKCRTCGGEYTSTDPMTCTCDGRKEDCANARQNLIRLSEYRELTK